MTRKEQSRLWKVYKRGDIGLEIVMELLGISIEEEENEATKNESAWQSEKFSTWSAGEQAES